MSETGWSPVESSRSWLRVDVAGAPLLEPTSLATPDPACREATRRHVEAVADQLAGPDASPLARLLVRLTATLATRFDVALRRFGRLHRSAQQRQP
jgi:hypothetical protein